MTKIYPLLLFILLSASNLFSQGMLEIVDSLSNGQLKIMPVAGYNLSTISLEVNESKTLSTPLHGFHLGIVFMRELPSRITAEAGFLVSTSGSSYDYTEEFIFADVNNDPFLFENNIHQKISTYNFIFPFKLKHRLGYKRLQYYLEYGIYFGVGVETNIFTDYSYVATFLSGETTTETFNEKENTTYDISNPFDFGIILGAGVELNTKWQLGASFSYGFVNQASQDVLDINYYYYIDDIRFQNRNLMITLGYII